MAVGPEIYQRRDTWMYVHLFPIPKVFGMMYMYIGLTSVVLTAAILLPVTLHALFAALIVYIDKQLDGELGLPSSIVSTFLSSLFKGSRFACLYQELEISRDQYPFDHLVEKTGHLLQ